LGLRNIPPTLRAEARATYFEPSGMAAYRTAFMGNTWGISSPIFAVKISAF